MIRLAQRGVRLVLLDIEGTTTPMTFVHDVLFPFARAHLGSWIRDADGSADLAEITFQLASEHAADVRNEEPVPPWHAGSGAQAEASVIAYANWLMDRDRKSPGLKRLQGLIWEQGYQAGALRGEVFPDVPPALRRWSAAGIAIAIYSSGSELAQRRLFASTVHGDLTPLITAFFDTAVGPKREAASYSRIASALGHAPGHILFISDVDLELTAAAHAGQQTLLSLRAGNTPQPDAGRFEAVHSFEDIV